MNVYDWENSSRAHRSKAKKTGTVVFHADETVDLSFDRLQKEYLLNKTAPQDDSERNVDEGKATKAPLMTAATARELKKMGFSGLLPCQAQCYRGIFNRRDVILHSRTGSGKTLAYALPIIERHLILEAPKAKEARGPFLLVFVFSNELAVQTKGVLAKAYPKLRIGVAGFDDLAERRCDIVVGTVRSMDEAIRGSKCSIGKRRRGASSDAGEAHESDNDESAENDDDDDDGDEEDEEKKEKGTKGEKKATKRPMKNNKKSKNNKDKDEDEDEDDLMDDADDDVIHANSAAAGVVSAADVRAIVVDEVDLTLGPRFSTVGRRMRNLLKCVRRANGALTDGLLTDFRSHHYVLCGATIPNWVIKAGFLGVKKYYYQLVTVGTGKLPAQLECFALRCPIDARVATAAQLLAKENLGRTVVFGTRGQITKLEETLTASGDTPFRSLNPAKDELERIAAMEDFNGTATSVLLCTDLAARGLDFVDVRTVLMLSLPSHNMSVETFVHRAGRTARATKGGRCLLLHDEPERDSMESICKSAHVTFKTYVVNPRTKKQSDADNQTRFSLTVKSAFKSGQSNVIVPSALDVLKKNMGELFSNASKIAEDESRQIVTFEYPVTGAHEVKRKLWKYAIKEVALK